MTDMVWSTLIDVDVPSGCLPCMECGEMCMKAEGVEDWNGRGRVLRIFSMCDESFNLPNDLVRTEFDPPEEARAAWNKMVVEGRGV